MLPYWAEALLYGVLGVFFYLFMLKRLRKRRWPEAPNVILQRQERKDRDDDQNGENNGEMANNNNGATPNQQD